MPPGCPACSSPTVTDVGLLSKGRYRLRRCTACRSEFYVDDGQDAGDREDELYWEQYKFDVYADPGVQHAFEQRYASLLREAEAHVGRISSVLDAGCGIGNFVAFAQQRGLVAVGTDVSRPAVEAAQGRGLTAFHADELMDRVPAGSVDALTMWDVVEHLIDPHSVLEPLMSRVKPGGAVLFETPDAAFPVRGALLALNRASRGRVNLTGPMYYWEHKIYFTEEGLRALLDSVGADLVLVRRATSVREKMSKQFAANARKGSWKAKVLRRAWPVLEAGFRGGGRGNKLLVVGRKR